jgi:hypothetical protein
MEIVDKPSPRTLALTRWAAHGPIASGAPWTVAGERNAPRAHRAQRMVYHKSSWYTIWGDAWRWRGHATPRSALGLQEQGT